MTTTIAIESFAAEFLYIEDGKRCWAPCSVHGIQTDSSTLNGAQLVCLAHGEDGMIGAFVIDQVRPVEAHYPRRPSA